MNQNLVKNIDYIINENGDLVFTSTFLVKRGYCCQSGCLNCPYDYKNKVDPNVPSEFQSAWTESVEDDECDD